ncbi:hypothetical protein VMCG_02114 [Cytospora schulzeri]|uniref:Uncharacterized protein n=1 Tax=Cytospora schulzeri TaxID=448051 RepID=A0A423X399_9PEZI|nr:hypothetical protein VMCG_02114 [Valsa malicola]
MGIRPRSDPVTVALLGAYSEELWAQKAKCLCSNEAYEPITTTTAAEKMGCRVEYTRRSPPNAKQQPVHHIVKPGRKKQQPQDLRPSREPTSALMPVTATHPTTTTMTATRTSLATPTTEGLMVSVWMWLIEPE